MKPLRKSRNSSRCVLCCVALLTVGCVGGARLVIKAPVEDQCVSAGLNGCDLIGEGVALYADGDALGGEQKLVPGLRANAMKAAELNSFADGLEQIGKVPGAGRYVASLQPAIRLVQKVAAETSQRQPARPLDPDTKLAPPAPNPAQDHQRQPRLPPTWVDTRSAPMEFLSPAPAPLPTGIAKFWMVAGNTLSTSCRFPGTPKMQCIRDIIDSRKIVTDVMVSPACAFDVMVASRAGLEFDWMIYAPAGKGAEIHGAQLPLESQRALYVGIVQRGEDPPADVRCGATTVWRAAADANTEKSPRQLAIEAIPSK